MAMQTLSVSVLDLSPPDTRLVAGVVDRTWFISVSITLQKTPKRAGDEVNGLVDTLHLEGCLVGHV